MIRKTKKTSSAHKKEPSPTSRNKATENDESEHLIVGIDDWHTFRTSNSQQIFCTDGPFGVNTASHHRKVSTLVTAFPCGINLCCTWDLELINQVASSVAEETHSIGANMVLGPCIDIIRHPNAGQAWQAFSEDPFLSGRVAVSYVNGIHNVKYHQQQQKGNEKGNGNKSVVVGVVGACLKHFCCYNQETERYKYNAIVSERALREIYLVPFEFAVKESNPEAVMTSYNRLNGEYTSENAHILKDILKGEWKYQGMIVSDWGGCQDLGKSITNGLSLKMPGPMRQREIDSLKQIPKRIINQAAKEVSECSLKLVSCSHSDPPANVRTQSHRSIAEESAIDSFVLLKNEQKTLPLNFNQIGSLLICGPNIRNFRYCGPGSVCIDCSDVSPPIFAIQDRIPSSVEVFDATVDPSLIEPGKIPNCEVALIFVGAPPNTEDDLFWRPTETRYEGESCDRKTISLPEVQNKLINDISTVIKHTVVILNVGTPISMPWISQVSSILWVGYPGCRAASSIISILIGDVSPSGKLSVTFPNRIEDCPSFSSFPCDNKGIGNPEFNVTYNEDVLVGYRHFEQNNIQPLFCFGHGLSYSKFEYNDILIENVVGQQQMISISSLSSGDLISISFNVSNIGGCDAKEISQLYISPPNFQQQTPIQQTTPNHQNNKIIIRSPFELKGFSKMVLKPGETKNVKMTIGFRSFAIWTTNGDVEGWFITPGIYTISIGSSLKDIRLKTTLNLQ